MGILLNRFKVVKLQEGGTIPVYSSYQVKQAQEGRDNPMLLLQKYASSGAPASKSTETKEAKKSPKFDIKGLTNDTEYLGSKAESLLEEMRSGVSTHGELWNRSNRGRQVTRELEHLQMVELPAALKSEEALKNSKENIDTKQHGGSWMFSGNKGYAMDREGKVVRISGSDIRKTDNDGNRLYTPLTRDNAYRLRRNSNVEFKEGDDLIPMVLNESFAAEVGQGRSAESVMEETVNKVYRDLGGESFKVTGGTQVEDGTGRIITTDTQTAKESNAKRLLNAWETIKPILKSGDGWQALMAEGYLNAPQKDVDELGADGAAEKYVNDWLYKDMAKRTNVSEEDLRQGGIKKDQNYVKPETEGNPLEKVENASKPLLEALGTGRVNDRPMVFTIPSQTEGKVTRLAIESKDANFFANSIDQNKMLSEQDKFNEIAARDESFTITGDRIDDLNWKFSGGEKSLKSLAMPTNERTDVKIADVAMVGNKVVNVEELDSYKKLLDDITKVRNRYFNLENAGLNTPSRRKKAQEDIARLADTWVKSHPEVKVKKVLVGEYIVPAIGAPDVFKFNAGGEDQKEQSTWSNVSNEEARKYYSWGSVNGDKGGMEQTIDAEVWNFGIFGGTASDDPENLRKVTLLTPIADYTSLQKADGEVKISRGDITNISLHNNFLQEGTDLNTGSILNLISSRTHKQ